ncbi:rodlin [Streptomyces humi]|uniref:rodlin n=1 Tax=Streptomyces humi TaxID=1428620 RepID=UPI0006287164|nr:rodlin [Streptomyces humi]
MKKMIVTTVLAVGLLGIAPQAMASDNDGGTTSLSGNNAQTAFGNSKTDGAMSPQTALVQGSLNNICAGVPVKVDAASLVGVVPVSVLQDVPILSAPQNQQCTENSTQAKGDEPLSHLLG